MSGCTIATTINNMASSSSRLVHCPHSIDVDRFRASAEHCEDEARRWRGELGNWPDGDVVVLFVGKFEEKKQPLALMQCVGPWPDPAWFACWWAMVSFGARVSEFAARYPAGFG